MIEQAKVSEILAKSKDIERQIEDNKKSTQQLNDRLIELNTKKQQILDELQNLGVSETTLDSKIEELYNEVQNGITKFEELNK